ncbi:iron-sulfur cluster assembly ATPase protein SufC [Lachnospiraceae bacterium KM106-2]|nr:iron-sulfur cluster assembly ATPase protein SufC [Lachnospiraceae bacterium KM106-2]
MGNEIVKIENLKVSVENKEILHGINLTIKEGETHVLMGPNGAGKSTLGYALMGHPQYRCTKGNIFLYGSSILEETPDTRARQGMFLSFQNPLEVPGVSLENFIRSALEQKIGKRIPYIQFRKVLFDKMRLLQMDTEYARRDLNVGFSGGEKKKAEILQLLMFEPTVAILDETDSGLDVDAVRTVSKGVQEYQTNKERGLLIITHSTKILESLAVDYTHILVDGTIVETGDASLIEEVNKNGFEQFLSCMK